jgi:hypothetical protein
MMLFDASAVLAIPLSVPVQWTHIQKILSGCLDDILCFCDTKQIYLPGD